MTSTGTTVRRFPFNPIEGLLLLGFLALLFRTLAGLYATPETVKEAFLAPHRQNLVKETSPSKTETYREPASLPAASPVEDPPALELNF